MNQQDMVKTLEKKLSTALLEKDAMKDAIEWCKNCSKRDCTSCDGILSEEWVGEAPEEDRKLQEENTKLRMEVQNLRERLGVWNLEETNTNGMNVPVVE